MSSFESVVSTARQFRYRESKIRTHTAHTYNTNPPTRTARFGMHGADGRMTAGCWRNCLDGLCRRRHSLAVVHLELEAFFVGSDDGVSM